MWWRFALGVLGAACLVPAILACSVDYIIWSKSKTSDTPLFRIVTSSGFGTGYINAKGKVVIRPQYDDYGNYGNQFHEGVAQVRSAKREIFQIDSRNRRLHQFDGLDVRAFAEGLAPAQREDELLYGFVDHKGKFVIPPQFEFANSFRDGFAAVQIEDRRGFIDHSGRLLTPQRFAEVTDFSEGLAWVVEKGDCAIDGLCGLFTLGQPPIAPAVLSRCRYSLLNSRGEILASEAYVDAKAFSDGLAPVSNGDLWGYADRTGKLVIPFRFSGAAPFAEGVASVCVKEKCGYIDKAGVFAIAPTFAGAGAFSEGRAWVNSQDGRFSFIDRTGTIVISGPFDAASDFVRGLAHVRVGFSYEESTWSYIDRTGKTIFRYNSHDELRP